MPKTFPGAILGYRSWFIDSENILHPLHHEILDFEWKKNSKFHCLTAGHTQPDPDCECGLYAWHDFEKVNGFPFSGAIAGRGHVELYEEGFREEEAQILALYINTLACNVEIYKALQIISQREEIPIFESPSEFKAFIKPLAEPCSKELTNQIPKKEVPSIEPVTWDIPDGWRWG